MKIAIVSPIILPVSDINGGAVEKLIMMLLDENEKNHKLDIDLYTIYSKNVICNYKYTKVFQIKINAFDIIIQKILNFLYKLFKIKYRYEAALKKTCKKMKKHTYNKVIVENRMNLYRLIYLETENKNNLIYHMHNDFDNVDKTRENYLFIENTSTKILVVSDYIKNSLENIKESKKIFVLNNCINLDDFNRDIVSNDKLESLYKKYSIDKGDLIISYFGRVTKEKGVLYLIKAFKELHKYYRNIKLLIVGSSWFSINVKETEFEKEIKKEISEIKENVIFAGYVNYKEIIYYYKITNFIVIPSICNEAFGLVALEGMSMGIPIISTNDGGLPYVLQDAAIVIDKNNDLQYNLFQNMKLFIEDPGIAEKYKNRGLDRIRTEKKFGKEEYYKLFLNYLK